MSEMSARLDELAARLAGLNVESKTIQYEFQELETGAAVDAVYLKIYADGDEDSIVCVEPDARVWLNNGMWLTENVMRVFAEIQAWQATA